MFRQTIAIAILLSGSLAIHAEEPIEFNRDIRPILSNNCFQCHGPDEKTREAGLRLDVRQHAVEDLGGYAAIVPGKAGDSEVITRIESDDPDLHMPPAESEKTLTDREKELLRRWVEEGAVYQEHWSFLPISTDGPPEVTSNWTKNGIDAFVLQRLEKQNIKPSGEADPYTLIKRMSLDLVGLLPEPERVESFVRSYEANPDAAVQSLADELLDNPHYGERWGRHWLDQARYADSHGYTIDGARTMWPYRDWVIQAINDDMPFDQFTVEQLAGDLLPNPTKSQLVATGFHRNTLINQEGGTDNEQFRNEEVVDRVNTTGAVWLGLTLGCAQCHTHKFDPLSQQEYYEFFAFFDHSVDVNNAGPTVEVYENELFLKDADPEHIKELEEAKQHLAGVTKQQGARQREWERTLAEESKSEMKATWTQVPIVSVKTLGDAAVKHLDDGSVLVGQGVPQESYNVSVIVRESGLEEIAAIRLRVLPHESLPQNGPGRAGNGNFVLTEINFSGLPIKVRLAQADHAQPNFPIAHAIDGYSRTGWAINVGKGSRPGVKMNAEHEAHFVFQGPVKVIDKNLTVVMSHSLNDNYNIGRFAFDVSPTPPANPHAEELFAAATTAPKERTDAQKKLIKTEFEKFDTVQREATTRLANARKALGLGSSANAMIMRELDKPRDTYLHIRGNFLRKDKDLGLLNASVPAVLPSLEQQQDRATRLDLATWLVNENNPLTARVTVNRVWMRYFGRGLVETENDFGTQGTLPTHPKLLDWLSRYFMENGWSMKKLHKLIVTSATYRQSSHHREDLIDIDPRNELLARQNRLRAEAEVIRDVALSASDLLNTKIGGPSVRPPQPDGVYAFTQQNKGWSADQGQNRFRRGLYTMFYRSAPYPMLTTFDSPDFQTVCTRRPRTNTPLQSLTLSNDEAFFEMMQGLAARLLSEVPGTDEAAKQHRIERAFWISYCRPPSEKESAAVERFLNQQQAHFEQDEAAAEALLTDKIPDDYEQSYAAAWVALARALMNTDEFITRE